MNPNHARYSGEPSTVEAARENVLDRLAERYEFFAEKEQEHRGNGDPVKAEGAHRYAAWVLRAYQVESDDPVPARRR